MSMIQQPGTESSTIVGQNEWYSTTVTTQNELHTSVGESMTTISSRTYLVLLVSKNVQQSHTVTSMKIYERSLINDTRL